MPTDLSDAAAGGTDLVFPDELAGFKWSLAELSVYDAEEVQDDLDNDGTPAYGRWIPATRVSPGTNGHGEELWLNAPGELVVELQRLAEKHADLVEKPAVLEVTRCEKSGDHATDPYEINVERSDGSGKQQALGG
jgi:hypothetical protein